jgi:hypothetical protein
MTRGDDVAQSPGPTEPKWGQAAGQSLAYFQKLFHTRVKGGRWSWSVMPKVGAARKLGCPATLADRPA